MTNVVTVDQYYPRTAEYIHVSVLLLLEEQGRSLGVDHAEESGTSSNISANSNLYSIRLQGMNHLKVGGRVLTEKRRKNLVPVTL